MGEGGGGQLLGDSPPVEIRLDKQPSVAITIQKNTVTFLAAIYLS